MSSLIEAEFGGLFTNTHKGQVIHTPQSELGNKQLPNPITTENFKEIVITHNTIKQQLPKSMDMWFYWVCGFVTQKTSYSPLAPWKFKHCILSHKESCLEASPMISPTLCSQKNHQDI